MKLFRTTIALIVVAMLFAGTASAALTANDAEAIAGETATLFFSFTDIYNVEGAFAIDDPQEIVKSYSVGLADGGTTSVTVVGDRLVAKPGVDPISADITVTVKVTLKEDAAVGESCTVFFEGVYGDANEEPGNQHEVEQAVTLAVKTAPVPVVPKPIDYSELNRQITIASGLNLADYTEQSANALQTALETAKTARSSKSQEAITIAAKSLKNAMSALVKMDYSELRETLEDVSSYVASEKLGTLWEELDAAVAAGEELLTSNDQSAVDTGEAEIRAVLTEIEGILEELKTPEVVEVEVPVEVLPDEDYCNIPMHRLWPVFFYVSLAANAVLVIVLITLAVKKKKYQNDDTPLVDYDMDFDFDDDI